MYCLFKLITWLTHDAIFMSILFRIVSSLNHFQLPLFVLSKVNVTCFKIFSSLVLSIQAYNMVKSRCFLILLLIRIFSSPNLFQLPLFVLSKVNVTCFKIFSSLVLSIQAYNMVKSRCFLILLLIRIFSSLNLFQLPLFVLSKVNVTFLR